MKYKNTENRFKAKLKLKLKYDDPKYIKDFERSFNEFCDKWTMILGPDVLQVAYKGMADKIDFCGGR